MLELDLISVRVVRKGGLASVAATLALTTAASASVVNYTDRDAFLAAAGPVNSIGVPDMPAGGTNSWMNPLGMSASAMHGGPLPNEFVSYWDVPQGTTVLIGPMNSTWQFTAPHATAFAMNWLFFQPVHVDAYYGTTYLGSVIWAGSPEGDYAPRFGGLVSTTPFSRLVFWNSQLPSEHCFGHTVMFSVIPTPGAGFVLALAALAPRRRR